MAGLTLSVLNNFDYCFAENGLTAFKLSKPLESNSFIQHVGEEQYKKICNWILRYFSELDIPIKRCVLTLATRPLRSATRNGADQTSRGTFIEFRRGMINVSPIGRNASYVRRVVM